LIKHGQIEYLRGLRFSAVLLSSLREYSTIGMIMLDWPGRSARIGVLSHSPFVDSFGR